MFSLIFYCGLISSVVSTHFNNDTSHDGEELAINTTLSTLASTTIPVSKDCVLEMKENEISQIVELFNRDSVNVVFIHISFSNSSYEGQLFSDFNVSLSNPIGREILYALERWEFRSFSWTLKVGIRNFNLSVNGSQNDCIKMGKNATDFVLESTQHIVDSINLATNYQICSFFKETSSGKVNEACCQMTKPYLAIKFNYKCPKENSFLFGKDSTWVVIYIIMFLFAIFYLMWLSLVFLSGAEFDLEYPGYYKLEESMMSPSFILLKLIWNGDGYVVFFIRCLLLLGVISFMLFVIYGVKIELYSSILLFSLSLSYIPIVSIMFRGIVINSSTSLNNIKERRNNVFQRYLLWYHNSDPLCKKSKKEEFEIVVKIIMLPFNPNVWRNVVNMLYNKCIIFARRVTERFNNHILKTPALCTYLVFAVLTCLVYACLFFCVLIVLATIYPILTLWNVFELAFSLQRRPGGFCDRFLFFLSPLWYFLLLLLSVLIVILVITSFLLGLFLNLIYFIPYLALFSVLTFYCYTYWKTMEEKYLVLKQLIYEACRETQNINNGCIPNRHPKPNEEVIPVVSKELYDKIRKKLLPYDTNLFYFGLKMFWSIAFSLGILALINMLNEFNVSALVQVVTTASLGVVPHILNTVGLKTSEAKTKASNEQLKIKVKYMVEQLIRKHPKLGRTVLIIKPDEDTVAPAPSLRQLLNSLCCNFRNKAGVENPELIQLVIHSDHGMTTDESSADNDDVKHTNLETTREIRSDFKSDLSAAVNNELARTVMTQEKNDTTIDESIQGSERVESTLGSNVPDNDNTEDIGPAQTVVIQENNGATSEENIEGSERVEARFGSNVPDNDNTEDVRPTQTVVIQENNGTTSEKNIEDSEHIEARFGSNVPDNDNTEDVRLAQTAVIQENNDATSEESIHDSGRDEPTFGSNLPDNENTEDVGPAKTVMIQGNNDATSQERTIQGRQRVKARLGSNPPSQDGELSVLAQEKNETTSDKNVQDSGHAPARSDFSSRADYA